MKLAYPFRVWEEDGSYIVQGLPPLDNVVTYGETVSDALASAREALTGVLGAMLDGGQPIPDPPAEDVPEGIYLVEPFAKVTAPVLLRKAREAAGLTQGELAERLGVSYQAVQKLERSGANPTVATLERVLRGLGWGLELELGRPPFNALIRPQQPDPFRTERGL